MKGFASLTLAMLATTALAKIGDPCRTNGVKGTCQNVGSCNTGVTVKGACPDDPDGVRCCIKKSCQQPGTSNQGMCFDKRNNNCSGGKFITNQCPGDNNMQCCIKSSTPPKPSCPAVHSVPIEFFPDDVIFSRKGTKETAAFYKTVHQVLDVCELAALAFPGPGEVVGLTCGLASLGTEFIADHAEECTAKNQCLKLKAYTVPFCVGDKDGCCG